MKRVFFDIDGTLINGFRRLGGPGFWKKLSIELGAPDKELEEWWEDRDGKTQKQNIFEALSKGSIVLENFEERWAEVRETIVSRYIELLESVNVFSDSKETLEYLKNSGFELGLITGNLREIAFAKLKLAGLDDYFSDGGFGDNLSREDAAREAVGDTDCGETFFVGDTPLDVKSGKSVGVKTIGIATGQYSMEDLKDAGADFVVENLGGLKEVLK